MFHTLSGYPFIGSIATLYSLQGNLQDPTIKAANL